VTDETYTGTADDKRYTSDAADVTYSLHRCIHAKECVNRLHAVFDTGKRPWIQPGEASADDLLDVIVRCPSGALHLHRKDGGAEETTPTENTVRVWRDGPLQFTGDLHIHGANVAVEGETRATLCRCGASKHKPFCDNTHLDTGFEGGAQQTDATIVEATGGPLHITATENGPLGVEGNVQITDPEGHILFTGDETWLCRCGGSGNKPFCDGTHNEIGFEAE